MKKKAQKQPFQKDVNAEDVTVFCPCGTSITGEGESVTQFMQAHKPHTNGKCTERLTADGQRFIRAFHNGKQTYTYEVK